MTDDGSPNMVSETMDGFILIRAGVYKCVMLIDIKDFRPL